VRFQFFHKLKFGSSLKKELIKIGAKVISHGRIALTHLNYAGNFRTKTSVLLFRKSTWNPPHSWKLQCETAA
jgi:hypothetical protein